MSVRRAWGYVALAFTFAAARIICKAILRLCALTFRYFVGLPMMGESSTDATWWNRGTERVRPQNWWEWRTPSRWSLLPFWKRAVVRLVVPIVAIVVAAAWSRWPSVVPWVLALVAGVASGCYLAKTWRRMRLAPHTREYVEPLHAVLSQQLGLPSSVRPHDWLHIPVGFHRDTARIRVALPPQFYAGSDPRDPEQGAYSMRSAGGARSLVDGIVYEKLGLSASEMTASYRMVGGRPVVEYRHIAHVPKKVSVDDIREHLAAAKDSELVLGIGRGGKVVKVNLDTEAPHVLFSVGTGGGKSNGLSAIAPHLARGARAQFLDLKRSSLRPFKDHPRVRYIRDVEQIHAELLGLWPELDRRNRLVDEYGEDADVGPRIFVVIEEINGLRDALSDYWQDIKLSSDNQRSPAVRALNRVLYMGRSVKIHVVTSAQLATAEALGGPAAREQFGARILGRASVQSWRMLAAEIPPARIPKKTTRAGHMHMVFGGDIEEFQMPHWRPKEIKELSGEDRLAAEGVTASQMTQEEFYLGRCHVTVTDDPSPAPDQEKHEESAQEYQQISKQASKQTSKLADSETSDAVAEPRLSVVEESEPENPDDRLVTFAEAAQELFPEENQKNAKDKLRQRHYRDKATFPLPVDNDGPAGGKRFRLGDIRRYWQNQERTERKSA